VEAGTVWNRTAGVNKLSGGVRGTAVHTHIGSPSILETEGLVQTLLV
jgi:hypothetical protein